MKKSLSECVAGVLEDRSIEALYIYGSYVNGYYRKDSDIDLVGLTSQNATNRPVEMPPNFSVHLIHPLTLQLFEIGYPYTHLRMVPVYNEKKCIEISDTMKSELVRRELIKFKNAGVEEFDVLDPLRNYLQSYGIQRPWRIKPIKRIFASEKALGILKEEYGKILDLLEEKGMIERIDDRFAISPNYVFDEEISRPKDSFAFRAKNSCFGWHYLRNIPSMIDFSRKII